MNTFTAVKSGSFSDPSVWKYNKVPKSGDNINLSVHKVVIDRGRGLIGLLHRVFPRLFKITIGDIDATEGGQLVIGCRDVHLAGNVKTTRTGTVVVPVRPGAED